MLTQAEKGILMSTKRMETSIQELNEDANDLDRLLCSFSTMATFATQPAPR